MIAAAELVGDRVQGITLCDDFEKAVERAARIVEENSGGPSESEAKRAANRRQLRLDTHHDDGDYSVQVIVPTHA